MFIRSYLRASTDNQDAERSKQDLIKFCESHSQRIAGFYVENISGTKADRPELDRLISDSQQGDILLIEKMDRLTRLPFEVWETLKARIKSSGIQIVVLDQPTTHTTLKGSDEATSAIQQALTNFMLDLGAAMARDDYETRMKRTKQGIEKAKAQGKYKGRPVSEETTRKCQQAQKLIDSGETVSAAVKAVGVSRAQYYKWIK
ncbi:recombinase family protein [Vibrio barjaei]|uniref:recombinase family protein n=1 Tax=Vibrio barjaei TaxID=1676683 RepID=UPI0022850EDE|nr:recombinase family protein [Vibrio barjaei]MCY9871810.1 recombinase family protein [Vibrio barjaei]